MPRIQVIEEENAKRKVKAVYDELEVFFWQSPWRDESSKSAAGYVRAINKGNRVNHVV